jgi:hypothetical protein
MLLLGYGLRVRVQQQLELAAGARQSRGQDAMANSAALLAAM